jgi:TonB-linked SusC/RagA family outer membrane protein
MKKALTILAAMALAISAFAQGTVTGTVTDAQDGYPLPGVAVILKGAGTGVETDLDGNFSIKASNGQTLVFSCIGYAEKEVVVSGSSLNVALETDSYMLDEVVAIGYGVMKKSDLTGSVASVKGDQLKKTPASGIDQALQGVAAGVTVNANSGQPGAAAEVRVRGIGTVNNSAPIFVVDGVIVDDISFLSPSDIASTEILKDASATAIYGSRGANGVILVTTTKGNTDGQISISFDANIGFQNPWRKLDLLTTDEYAIFLSKIGDIGGYSTLKEQGRDAWIRSRMIGNTSKYHPSNLDYSKTDTDWQEAVFNRNAIIQNYHLAVNGGNNQGQWSVSASWFNQDGTIIGSNYSRLTLRANSSYNVKKWLKIGENLNFMYGYGRTAMNNNASAQASILSAALSMSPWDPVTYPQGSHNHLGDDLSGKFAAPTNFKNVTHPYAMVDYSHPMDKSDRWVGDIFVDITPIKGLVWHNDISMDLSNVRHRLFKEAYIVSQFDKMDKNFLEKNMTRYRTLIFESTLTWMKDFGKHSVNLMAGTTLEEYQMESLGGSGAKILIPRETNWYLSQTTEDRNPAGDGAARNRRQSFLARAHYNFDSRYLLTVNFRADGTSKFTNHVWGFFPSVAAAWRVDNEPWLPKPEWLEGLKVRAGWGRIGNDKIGDNASVQTMFNSGPTFVDYVLGQNQDLAHGATILTLVNSDIMWEATEQMNVGVDLGLWKNKLTATVDFFIRDTKDMLLGVTAPAHVGNRYAATANVGTVRNSGIELTLEHRNHIGDWDYSLNGNVSFIKNQLTALNGGSPVYGDRTISTEGLPLYTFWGYEYLGIYQSDQELTEHLFAPGASNEYNVGDAKYKDQNGDGRIDNNDLTNLGNPFPWLTYGLTASAGWKGFDLQVFFQGVAGNKIYNALRERTEGTGNSSQLAATMRNVWTPDHTTGVIPNPFGGSHNKDNNSRLVEDGAYLRLKNIQLGYTLPEKIVNKVGLSRCRVYVSCTNLFTVTGYTGYDPEVGGGVDYGNYPQSRTVQMGLNLNF